MQPAIRLDKWLWAARFFKTRPLAEKAITGGKVHANGERCKPSKRISIGMMLTIRQGADEREVKVIALSDQRGPFSQAQLLYEETPDSISKRTALAQQRRLAPRHAPPSKPSKRQRQQIRSYLGKE